MNDDEGLYLLYLENLDEIKTQLLERMRTSKEIDNLSKVVEEVFATLRDIGTRPDLKILPSKILYDENSLTGISLGNKGNLYMGEVVKNNSGAYTRHGKGILIFADGES